MNKNSFVIVDEAFEKIAARAWKKNIGKLGDKSLDKLKKSGVLDHSRELAGLKKGTENIVAKNGGIIDTTRNGKHLKKAFKKTVKEMVGSKDYKQMLADELNIDTSKLGGKLKTSLLAHASKKSTNIQGRISRRAGRNLQTILPPDLKGTKKGVVGAGDMFSKSKGIKDKLADALTGGMGGFRANIGKDISKKFDREYANAIFARHEADELRTGMKLMRKGKTDQYGKVSSPTARRRIFSHVDPEVLHRESANVAIAPKSVKKGIKNMRNTTGEIDTLKTDGKLNFGESGVFDKYKSKKHGNSHENFNRRLQERKEELKKWKQQMNN